MDNLCSIDPAGFRFVFAGQRLISAPSVDSWLWRAKGGKNCFRIIGICGRSLSSFLAALEFDIKLTEITRSCALTIALLSENLSALSRRKSIGTAIKKNKEQSTIIAISSTPTSLYLLMTVVATPCDSRRPPYRWKDRSLSLSSLEAPNIFWAKMSMLVE
ncbi:hypothetical protein SISSUDRAFT_135662 [Sistotremastrum suecicum HHB10207 ss-3]|uniref:Uncharacterized protein n=1 Tax=Sistotremastrum suecicum HHB10207 ss-3 TaxID=1314776 RepID=A0A166AVJ3_9AGAM|nr:hypothetical protein SISSUDRAFT_135662 [Sistotremastrum suecicum HHB10207 ss-3]